MPFFMGCTVGLFDYADSKSLDTIDPSVWIEPHKPEALRATDGRNRFPLEHSLANNPTATPITPHGLTLDTAASEEEPP